MKESSEKILLRASKILGYAVVICAAIWGYIIIPYQFLGVIQPYTQTTWAGVKALNYSPVYFPFLPILTGFLVYWIEKGNLEIACKVFLWITLFASGVFSPLLSLQEEKDFLGKQILYAGQCEVLSGDASGEGANRRAYVVVGCGSHQLVAWNPDILVHAINRPKKSFSCKLSAIDSLDCDLTDK